MSKVTVDVLESRAAKAKNQLEAAKKGTLSEQRSARKQARRATRKLRRVKSAAAIRASKRGGDKADA